jgi:hypothetical protein
MRTPPPDPANEPSSEVRADPEFGGQIGLLEDTMKKTRSVTLLALSLGAVVLSGCIPISWSAERQAAAVDACQKARAIAAPIPNPAAGTPVYSSDPNIDYVLDALEYLLRDETGRRFRRPPRRPLFSSSSTHRDWIPPTEAVVSERRDAIRVSVIRSGSRKLAAAHESSLNDLLEECRRQDLIP